MPTQFRGYSAKVIGACVCVCACWKESERELERAVGQTLFVYCPLAWPEGQPERSGKATVQERKAERGKGNLEAGKEKRSEG